LRGGVSAPLRCRGVKYIIPNEMAFHETHDDDIDPLKLADEIDRRRLKFADIVDGHYEMPSEDEHHCIIRALRKTQELREALTLTQFGFNHSRCPVCAGRGVGPYGETDKAHTADCPVGKALAKPE
jgi:hypothetical protein